MRQPLIIAAFLLASSLAWIAGAAPGDPVDEDVYQPEAELVPTGYSLEDDDELVVTFENQGHGPAHQQSILGGGWVSLDDDDEPLCWGWLSPDSTETIWPGDTGTASDSVSCGAQATRVWVQIGFEHGEAEESS